MGFFLFLLVNAALFIRPAELSPALKTVPIYEILILSCFACSILNIVQQFTKSGILVQPITVFVLALIIPIFVSSLATEELSKAWEHAFEFLKVLVYFVLLISVVNTPRRLRYFLICITLFAAAVTLIAVLDYNQVIDLKTLQSSLKDTRNEESPDHLVFNRLRATGIFSDPNDFSLLLVIAIPLSLHLLIDGTKGFARFLWLVPVLLFGYALLLTQSRGGLLSVMFGTFMVLWGRLGFRAALTLALVMCPALIFFLATRQRGVITTDDTAQLRFQLWSDAFQYLKESPLIGIGVDKFKEQSGLVAHNSFLHCFGELGFVGGFLFFAAVFCAVWGLFQLRITKTIIINEEQRSWNPYLMGMVSGAAMLMMTLSLSYLVPTYMLLGVAVVHLNMAQTYPLVDTPKLNGPWLVRIFFTNIAFLGVLYIAAKILVRWE